MRSAPTRARTRPAIPAGALDVARADRRREYSRRHRFAERARGIARHNGVVRNVARYHAAGSDHGIFADGYAAQDGGAGSNRSPVPNPSGHDPPIGLHLRLPARVGSPGILVVDQGDVVPDEHVVFDGHTLVDKRVAGNLHVPPDVRVFLNLDECPNSRVIANRTAIQVYESMNAHIATHADIRRNLAEFHRHPLPALLALSRRHDFRILRAGKNRIVKFNFAAILLNGLLSGLQQTDHAVAGAAVGQWTTLFQDRADEFLGH